jgi:transcriptional regulator with XRE-family HTH domain
MKIVKDIRQKIGLSQEAFAIILGISRDQLAQIETSCREISMNAFIKLGEVENALNSLHEFQPDTDDLMLLTQELEAHRHEVNRQLDTQRKLLNKLRIKLAKNESLFNSACQSLPFLEEERRLFEGVTIYLEDLNKIYIEQKKNFIKFHPNANLALKMKISEIETLIIVLQNEIENLPL